jgi:hypothetical protein
MQIVELRQVVLPASALGKACSSALGQWSRMEKYLEHGHVGIDNNHCENGIRPLAAPSSCVSVGESVAASIFIYRTGSSRVKTQSFSDDSGALNW